MSSRKQKLKMMLNNNTFFPTFSGTVAIARHQYAQRDEKALYQVLKGLAENFSAQEGQQDRVILSECEPHGEANGFFRISFPFTDAGRDLENLFLRIINNCLSQANLDEPYLQNHPNTLLTEPIKNSDTSEVISAFYLPNIDTFNPNNELIQTTYSELTRLDLLNQWLGDVFTTPKQANTALTPKQTEAIQQLKLTDAAFEAGDMFNFTFS